MTKELNRTTKLAFYKGKRSENKKSLIGDWLICLVTGSRFSHVELIRSHAPAAGVSIDFKPWTGQMATMLSSSLRDGGVRQAWRAIDPGRWVIVEFDSDPSEAIKYVESRIGTPYGWFDLLGFLLPFRVSSAADFCSEVIAAGLKLSEPWTVSPQLLYEWAEDQPGFKVSELDGVWSYDHA